GPGAEPSGRVGHDPVILAFRVPAGHAQEGAAPGAEIDLLADVDGDLDLRGPDVLPAELAPAVGADEAAVLLAVNAVLDRLRDALGPGRGARRADAGAADVARGAVEGARADQAFPAGFGGLLAGSHDRKI